MPTRVHPQVAPIGPTQIRKRLRERGEAKVRLSIVFVETNEPADAPYAVALLCPCCQRPYRSRGAEEGDEIAASHDLPPAYSISSSARSRKASGMVSPMAL